MGTTFIVAVFYCLDALHGERRDRSIRSGSPCRFPISPRCSPRRAFAGGSSAAYFRDHRCHALDHAAAEHRGTAGKRSERHDAMDPFAVVAHVADVALPPAGHSCALVRANLRGLLLVSGWARRAPFLWAALPLLAIGVVEKIAFNTSHFAAMLGPPDQWRAGRCASTVGGMSMDSLTQLTPGQFLISPGLWIGLAVRRYSSPQRCACAAIASRSDSLAVFIQCFA